jgi:WD40 repeat protein
MTHYIDHKLQTEQAIVIAAHTNAIAQLALNKDGSLLATTSAKGTLIRLFNPVTGDKLHELRRGSEEATI